MSVELDEVDKIYREADCLFNREQVNEAIAVMGKNITAALKDTNPLVLCLMNGGLVIGGRLLTLLDFPLQLDYIHATRYCNSTTGFGLEWIVKPRHELTGRTVLVVDDILDEGITLHEVLDFCRAQNASAVYSAVLVEKVHSRRSPPDINADFIGLKVPDRYVFGYGMDYKAYLRNAPGIYAVAGT